MEALDAQSRRNARASTAAVGGITRVVWIVDAGAVAGTRNAGNATARRSRNAGADPVAHHAVEADRTEDGSTEVHVGNAGADRGRGIEVRADDAEHLLDACAEPVAVGASVGGVAIVGWVIDALAEARARDTDEPATALVGDAAGGAPARNTVRAGHAADGRARDGRRALAVVVDGDSGAGRDARVRIRFSVATADRIEDEWADLGASSASAELARTGTAPRHDGAAIVALGTDRADGSGTEPRDAKVVAVIGHLVHGSGYAATTGETERGECNQTK